MDYKTILGTIAAIIAVAGYFPYIRDSLASKTKPHIFTWFIGVSVALIAFGLQVQDGAGPGALPTLTAALVGGLILILAIRNKDKNITPIDFVALVLAVFALFAWLIAKDPVLSTALVVLAEVLSFIPTIRKSWDDPYSETLSSYLVNFFRFVLALLALNTYSFVAIGYPLTWSLMHGGFALFIIARRNRLSLRTLR